MAALIQITSDPLGGPVPRLELTIDEKELSALSRLEVVIIRTEKIKPDGVYGTHWCARPIARYQYFISNKGKLYAPGKKHLAQWQDGRGKKQSGRTGKSTK